MRRWLFALLAWLVATAALVPACFFVVILVAGPHSDLLPATLQPLVLALGWLVVLAGPILCARSVLRRTRRAVPAVRAERTADRGASRR